MLWTVHCSRLNKILSRLMSTLSRCIDPNAMNFFLESSYPNDSLENLSAGNNFLCYYFRYLLFIIQCQVFFVNRKSHPLYKQAKRQIFLLLSKCSYKNFASIFSILLWVEIAQDVFLRIWFSKLINFVKSILNSYCT